LLTGWGGSSGRWRSSFADCAGWPAVVV